MKTPLLMILCLSFFASCSRYSANIQEKDLLVADSLADKYSFDKASQIISTISFDSLSSNEMRIRYALLLTKLRDTKSDSLKYMPAQYYDKIKSSTISEYKSSLSYYRCYILISILIMIYALYYQLSTRRKMKAAIQKQQEMKIRERYLTDEILNIRDEINGLTASYNASEEERLRQEQINYCIRGLLDEEKKRILSLQNTLAQKDEEIIRLNNIKLQRLIIDTPIYDRILLIKQNNAQYNCEKITLSDKEWDELISEINQIYAETIAKLTDANELLTDSDLRFCSLVKAGFSFPDIALIWGCTLDGVYKREKSILHRMKKGKDEKLKFALENK